MSENQERGEPSPHLQDAIRQNQLESQSTQYEQLTDAVPEQGLYHIVGGYLDDNGKVHSEVHLRSMSGDEEDLLGNRNIPIMDRLQGILKNCTVRIGDITDRGEIASAIDRLPIGSRMHLLVCLRRTTHWRRTKDVFDMEVKCPNDECGKKSSCAVDLSTIETYEMPNPGKREFTVHLTDAGEDVVWRVASFSREKVLDKVTDHDNTSGLTYAIITRLVRRGDEDVRLSIDDFLTPDQKKLKMSAKATQLFQWAKKLSVNDREELRESFLDEEPGIESTIEIDCPKCGYEFESVLGVFQEGFWFPTVTSKRSNRRSST